jgi:ArsR family transcriptional regulator, arsenate/arsenite/antimonite-responsive transcriptional repressor
MKAVLAFGKALADPTRLRVLALLRERELCVCEICDALEISQSTLSTHLAILRDASAVRTRKEEQWIYYSVEPARTILLDTFFQHHRRDLDRDKRLQRDAKRMKQRMRLREKGRCVRGFDQLKSKRKAA